MSHLIGAHTSLSIDLVNIGVDPDLNASLELIVREPGGFA